MCASYPRGPEDMPGCPCPHLAQESVQQKSELKRGAALCEPADYTLDAKIKKPVLSPRSALDLGPLFSEC